MSYSSHIELLEQRGLLSVSVPLAGSHEPLVADALVVKRAPAAKTSKAVGLYQGAVNYSFVPAPAIKGSYIATMRITNWGSKRRAVHLTLSVPSNSPGARFFNTTFLATRTQGKFVDDSKTPAKMHISGTLNNGVLTGSFSRTGYMYKFTFTMYWVSK